MFFFFLHKKGDYFKYCSLEVDRALQICFIIRLNHKLFTSNKLNMGFLGVPNLVPWSLMSISSGSEPELLLINSAGSGSTSTGQGGYTRKRRWGWRGRLFEEGDYFKCFRLRGLGGGGSGEIIRKTAIIRGNRGLVDRWSVVHVFFK